MQKKYHQQFESTFQPKNKSLIKPHTLNNTISEDFTLEWLPLVLDAPMNVELSILAPKGVGR